MNLSQESGANMSEMLKNAVDPNLGIHLDKMA
ncbi:hypothetical protein GOM49_06945 [Clostridium bovifaecis]|uniref:Motility protein n=1 Tax=Clostridium bovifaecis TaxID=2184719 RepID=A0A6I6EXA1_9CLOT|nr:hypothetical protein GOM49_06945 [Clostridium bovifaecis]